MQIYLDNNATTPVSQKVISELLPYLHTHFGNASSTHNKGLLAQKAIDKARKRVANAIGAEPSEIVFTSGGSESNNLAIKGVFFTPQNFCKGHLIISSFEHAAVREPALYLEKVGVKITIVSCSPMGLIDPNDIRKAIRTDTKLISIMHANNEIGTIQPISEIAKISRKNNILLHTDAAQSVGKTDVHVDRMGVDLLTIAGHKLYAPKGIGALYIRKGIQLNPLIQGVGHEQGRRAGTENVAYQVALGAAMELVQTEGPSYFSQMKQYRDLLFSLLKRGIGDELTQNGAMAPRLPNTLSVNFPNVSGAQLLQNCPAVCASTSAACHSRQTFRTNTQKAIGLSAKKAAGTVRFSLGWRTTEQEIRQAAAHLLTSYRDLTNA